MSTTPVPPSWLFAAQTTVSLILAVIGVTILIGAGAGAYGLALPHDAGGYLVSLAALVLTAAATVGLGLLVAAVARSPQIAQALTLVLFYPLAFFSGLYVPLQEIHSQLITDIGKVLPTGSASPRSTPRSAATLPASSRCSCSSPGRSAHASSPLRLFRWE